MTGTYRTRFQSANARPALPRDRIRLITATRRRADVSTAKDRGSMPDLEVCDLDNYAENQDGFAASPCQSEYRHGDSRIAAESRSETPVNWAFPGERGDCAPAPGVVAYPGRGIATAWRATSQGTSQRSACCLGGTITRTRWITGSFVPAMTSESGGGSWMAFRRSAEISGNRRASLFPSTTTSWTPKNRRSTSSFPLPSCSNRVRHDHGKCQLSFFQLTTASE